MDSFEGRSFEQMQNSTNRNGISHNEAVRTKRRPLPPIPPDAEKFARVQQRDVGIMTSHEMRFTESAEFSASTATRVKPGLGSSFSNHSVFDERDSMESLKSSQCSKTKWKIIFSIVGILLLAACIAMFALHFQETISPNEDFSNDIQEMYSHKDSEEGHFVFMKSADKSTMTTANKNASHRTTKSKFDYDLTPTPSSKNMTSYDVSTTGYFQPRRNNYTSRKSEQNRKQGGRRKKHHRRQHRGNKLPQDGSKRGSQDPKYWPPHIPTPLYEQYYHLMEYPLLPDAEYRSSFVTVANKHETAYGSEHGTTNKIRHNRNKHSRTLKQDQRFPVFSIRRYDLEPGSASGIREPDVDIINDVIQPKEKQSFDTISSRNPKIFEGRCRTVLPYSNFCEAGHITSSRVTLTLLNYLKVFATSRSNESHGQCDSDSALKFVCALKFPQCTEGLKPLPLCSFWCRKILSSCVMTSFLPFLNDHLRHYNATSAKMALRKKIPTRKKLNADQIVSEICNQMVGELSSAPESDCLNLSSYSSPTSLPNPRAQVSSQLPTDPCISNGGFSCVSSGQCIDKRWVCDGNNNCGEWEDEKDCVTDCDYDQFQCRSGQCVAAHQVCDGYQDCFDRSDESDCETCSGNLTSCGNRQCILSTWWCDGDIDCGNGKDEAFCSCEARGLQTCDEHLCISRDAICDGVQDCHDNSDEEDCSERSLLQCSPWMMACDQSCMPVTKQCDNVIDCSSGLDEMICSQCEEISLETCNSLSYNVTMFPNFLGHLTQAQVSLSPEYLLMTSLVHTRCHPLLRELGCSILTPPLSLENAACSIARDNRRKRLLPCRSLCAEIEASCRTLLDTLPMTWPSFLECNNFPENNNSMDSCLDAKAINLDTCSMDEFRCINKGDDETQCVAMMSRCDGKEQCKDGSDELDCDCELLNRFQCKDTGRCIASEWVCDTHSDCNDGSDEEDCANCSMTQRPCDDYSCVNINLWCDGNDDCPDGSDEAKCIALIPRGLLHNTRALLPSKDVSFYKVGMVVGFDFSSQMWLPICSHTWDAFHARLACSQMGFQDAEAFSSLPYFIPRSRLIRNYPIKIRDTHRVHRLQETFLHRQDPCPSQRLVHVRCRTKACGQRYDPLDGGHIFSRILGGRTSRGNKWPWLASLQLQGMNHVCGATLVRPQWMISAAHCFQERNDVGVWKAKISGIKIQNSVAHNISQIIIHPRYASQAVDFDVALVRLERPAWKSNQPPLCLPTTSFDSGAFCVIAGWGITETSRKSAHKLREGYVHVIERETCQQYYPNHFISNRMICAGMDGITDACSGDSGGPLMCWEPQHLQWQLAGITSWGSSCTPHSAPGVYTDVRYFVNWAKTTMNQEFG